MKRETQSKRVPEGEWKSDSRKTDSWFLLWIVKKGKVCWWCIRYVLALNFWRIWAKNHFQDTSREKFKRESLLLYIHQSERRERDRIRHCTFSQAHHKQQHRKPVFKAFKYKIYERTHHLSDYIRPSFCLWTDYVCCVVTVYVYACVCLLHAYAMVVWVTVWIHCFAWCCFQKLWLLFWCIRDLRYNECGSFLIFARKSFTHNQYQKNKVFFTHFRQFIHIFSKAIFWDLMLFGVRWLIYRPLSYQI